MSKTIKEYTNSLGLITAGPPDFNGGDTCSRQMTIGYCTKICFPERDIFADYENKLNLLLDKPTNHYIRCPDPVNCCKDPLNFSRDQMIPLMAFLMAEPSHTWHKWNLLWQHAKHGFLFAFNWKNNNQYPTQTLQDQYANGNPWNYKSKMPDITFLDIWGLWIRVLRLYPLWPLLLITDFYNIFGSLIRVYQTYAFKWFKWGSGPDRDNQNIILICDTSIRVMPTPLGYLAYWLLKTTDLTTQINEFFIQRQDQPPVDQYLFRLLGYQYQDLKVLPCEEP
jgi:hypothetical protein